MKRIAAIILSALVLIAFSACGGDSEDTTETGLSTVAQTDAETLPEASNSDTVYAVISEINNAAKIDTTTSVDMSMEGVSFTTTSSAKTELKDGKLNGVVESEMLGESFVAYYIDGVGYIYDEDTQSCTALSEDESYDRSGDMIFAGLTADMLKDIDIEKKTEGDKTTYSFALSSENIPKLDLGMDETYGFSNGSVTIVLNGSKCESIVCSFDAETTMEGLTLKMTVVATTVFNALGDDVVYTIPEEVRTAAAAVVAE